jgi:hypothetical protein
MPGRKRPNERRWLLGAVLGASLLLLNMLLTATDREGCEVLRAAGSACSGAPPIVFEVLMAAAGVCVLHSVFRAYRDFFRGDLDRDFAIWAGRGGQQTPLRSAPPAYESTVTEDQVSAHAEVEPEGTEPTLAQRNG